LLLSERAALRQTGLATGGGAQNLNQKLTELHRAEELNWFGKHATKKCDEYKTTKICV
jgi:hypothetical protein